MVAMKRTMLPVRSTSGSMLHPDNSCGSARQIRVTAMKIKMTGIRFLIMELVFMDAKILQAVTKNGD